LTFWIFSLALSGFNGLFSLTGISHRVPFPQPGATTIVSFGALVVFGLYLALRGARKPARQPETPASAPALVGAAQPSPDLGATTTPSAPPSLPQG